MKLEYQLNRENGYLDGMKKFVPDFQPLICRLAGPEEMENISYLSELVKQWNEEKVDAVICESDQLAAAIGRAAQMNGCSIPETFSLIGFGNSIISENFNPPLATISQDFEEMGSRTVNWLTDVIEKKGSVLSSGCRITTGFIQRESIYGKEK
jgi:DNA-binding LacI/PurR family transcriptional regulator